MTNFITRPTTLALSILAGLALAGCSTTSKPLDAGERLSARGDAIASRGGDWTDGQQSVAKGRTLVAKSGDRIQKGEKRLAKAREAATQAEDMLKSARDDRAKGEGMIVDGSAKMARAEAEYTAIRAGAPAVNPK